MHLIQLGLLLSIVWKKINNVTMHAFRLQNVKFSEDIFKNVTTTLTGQEAIQEHQLNSPLSHTLKTTNAINVTLTMIVICQTAVTKLEQG